jgi:hypothetical protein
MTEGCTRTWLCRIIVVSAACAMIAGCSSSSKTTTPGAPTRTQPPPSSSGFVDAGFRTRVAATCKTAATALHAEGPFPFPNFDPAHPIVADLPRIGAYEAKTVTALRTWQSSLKALGQPTAGSVGWKGFVSAVDRDVASTMTQQGAAQRSDAVEFTKTDQDLTSRVAADTQAAAAIGLPTCMPTGPQ